MIPKYCGHVHSLIASCHFATKAPSGGNCFFSHVRFCIFMPRVKHSVSACFLSPLAYCHCLSPLLVVDILNPIFVVRSILSLARSPRCDAAASTKLRVLAHVVESTQGCVLPMLAVFAVQAIPGVFAVGFCVSILPQPIASSSRGHRVYAAKWQCCSMPCRRCRRADQGSGRGRNIA